MPPAAAAKAALCQFGNTGIWQEDRRNMGTIPMLEVFWRDLRYGARQLWLNPLFTAVAVLSLALGIGANTAVFTLLDQLVLRLLPVHDPEQLVMIWPTGPVLGNVDGNRATSYPMYQDFERKAAAFSYVFCRYDQQLAMSAGDSTERVNGELVSGNYFEALGAQPALGRVLSPEADDRIYKGHPVVVLSHRFWANRFSGDPSIVGKKIRVNNYPMEVVGVAAPGFVGLDPSSTPDLWVPIQMKPLMTPGQDSLGDRRTEWVNVFARMKRGYTVQTASAALQPLFHQMLVQELGLPELSKVSAYDRQRFLKRTANVETAATGYSGMRAKYSTALVVLMGMAALILVIACANVASLLIARAVARQREMAVRLAIGAGRTALIRQLLVESLLLALSAAVLGLALSVLTTRALLAMLPSGSTLLLHAEPDLRILAFGVGLALLTSLLFGLAPALQGTKLDLATTLKDVVGAVTGGGRSSRLRKVLVTAQVALSFLLLAGAGLFARTLFNLRNTHSGFQDIGHLITFQVDPGKLGYSVPRIRSFYEDALREIRATPGVESAAYSVVPLFRGYNWSGPMAVEGHQAKDGVEDREDRNVVSPGYWRTLGVPLLKGRDFDERERFDGRHMPQMPSAAIVNRKFAEHFFGQESPIGRHIGNMGDRTLPIQIIGEVEDSLYEGPRQGVPMQVFYAHPEAPVPLGAYFYVRTTRDPKAMFPMIRQVLGKLDPSLPVDDMKTLKAQLDETLSTERLIASLSVVFGGLATLLAAIGLYGVMAFVVVRRTKEIGLRLALGAPRGSVLWLVLREALILIGAGLLVGAPAYYLLSKYAASQLFGLTPVDAWTCAGSMAILVIVAVFSGFVPARRASGIDPITALRYE
jgi:predicted permease